MNLCPDEDDEYDLPVIPSIDVEIGGPEILGQLLGPDGEVMYTLIDRPIIPFGFCR